MHHRGLEMPPQERDSRCSIVVVHPIYTRGERNRSWRRRRAHRSYAWLILEEAPTTCLDGDHLPTGHSLIRSTPFLPGWKTHTHTGMLSQCVRELRENKGRGRGSERVCKSLRLHCNAVRWECDECGFLLMQLNTCLSCFLLIISLFLMRVYSISLLFASGAFVWRRSAQGFTFSCVYLWAFCTHVLQLTTWRSLRAFVAKFKLWKRINALT